MGNRQPLTTLNNDGSSSRPVCVLLNSWYLRGKEFNNNSMQRSSDMLTPIPSSWSIMFLTSVKYCSIDVFFSLRSSPPRLRSSINRLDPDLDWYLSLSAVYKLYGSSNLHTMGTTESLTESVIACRAIFLPSRSSSPMRSDLDGGVV